MASTIACTAYSRYILDIGQSEDWLALQMALAPCLIGYGAIATRLYNDENDSVREGNRFWKWVENYVAEDYTEAVKIGSGMCNPVPNSRDSLLPHQLADSIAALLEEHVRRVSPSRLEDLIRIFIRATELEIGFWDMGLSGK